MFGNRGSLDVEDLLKIVLVLVIVWMALNIVDMTIGLLFGPLEPLVGLVIVAVIVAWLLDYI